MYDYHKTTPPATDYKRYEVTDIPGETIDEWLARLHRFLDESNADFEKSEKGADDGHTD